MPRKVITGLNRLVYCGYEELFVAIFIALTLTQGYATRYQGIPVIVVSVGQMSK